MNSYGYFPPEPPSPGPPPEAPGKNEWITLTLFFLAGCSLVLYYKYFWAIVGVSVFLAAGLVGLWESRSWTKDDKAVITTVLLLPYIGLMIFMIASPFADGNDASMFARFAEMYSTLMYFVGTPSAFILWLAVVFRTWRAHVKARTSRPQATVA